MDKSMMTYIIIALIIGFIVGIIFINFVSQKGRKYAKVKRELEQAQEELASQKQMMVKHFSHSAEILDNMAKDFRRLYQHIAETSGQFVTSDDMPMIDLEAVNNDISVKNELTLEKQPKDYSDNPSGLFKNDEVKS
ncbi:MULTISPECIES: YhcB family protein [unclassified Gilliamella]|uniref:YhcB family protein n=1 Tax=unclassified Gilliamella TaxID=2685620 RepID=UPI00226AF5D4|nr:MULTISPECIES: YhcB family protein [unclassified Gilliamella]MCX8596277.1 YhcB family protein [Gilliamella sp. B3493]MCX8598644.1 YhcB family protein [Gilliamella sp. B3486]MCX8682808.1 YhcB family protein [Gilliamella sp. B2889]MCX8689348.1 YhcB family protein [Gilliamella sp. B2973]MCX8705050.1 YhcB family protein [Gilliamella sp. B3127]